MSLTYVVTGRQVEAAALLRSMELSATKYCPAHFMLAQAFPIELRYEIYEEGDGNRRLISQGILRGLFTEYPLFRDLIVHV